MGSVSLALLTFDAKSCLLSSSHGSVALNLKFPLRAAIRRSHLYITTPSKLCSDSHVVYAVRTVREYTHLLET